jgi:Kef-type K+ transport system membrane component KefB
MVIPMIVGVGIGEAFGAGIGTSLFIGASLVATSVGITSAVLVDLGALKTLAARTILGAAVIDDILAIVVLAIAVGVAEGAGLDVPSVLLVLLLAIGFVLFVGFGGSRVVARWPDVFHAPKFSESPLLPAVILCLGLAALAAELGLAAIIGAFIAGMIVAESKNRSDFEEEVAPLYAFFPPFFFVFIGLKVDLGALASLEVLGALAGITLLALGTKFLGAWAAARSLGPRNALAVGIGMVPRGEVGIIVAGIGAAAGVVSESLFTVIVGMSILTTLVAPPLLKRVIGRDGDDGAAVPTGESPV